MPFLALLLVVGILILSHVLRGDTVALVTDIHISNIAFWLIVALACIRFGFSSDFWGDVFLCVLYSVGAVIEGYGLLWGVYEVSSPLREKAREEEDVWVDMKPKG
jgi:hypothetical protein